MDTFGKRLKYLRKKSGLSTVGLEKVAKISNVSRYENDANLPNLEAIQILCRFFKVSADWLVLGIESTPETKKAEVITDPDLAFAFQVLTDLYQHPNQNMRGWAKVQFNKAFEDEIEKKKQADISTIA